MSLCLEIERHLSLQSPGRRCRQSTPSGTSADELIAGVRRVGPDSDRTIRLLLEADARADTIELLLVAFIPMLRHRCRNDLTQVDEALGELSIVLVEMARSGVPATERRLANVIVDKAWDAHRATMRRARRADLPVDPQRSFQSNLGSPEDGHRRVLDRVAMHDFRRQLMHSAATDERFAGMWNEVLELAALKKRSSVERSRYKYVRQQLRRVAPAEMLV